MSTASAAGAAPDADADAGFFARFRSRLRGEHPAAAPAMTPAAAAATAPAAGAAQALPPPPPAFNMPMPEIGGVRSTQPCAPTELPGGDELPGRDRQPAPVTAYDPLPPVMRLDIASSGGGPPVLTLQGVSLSYGPSAEAAATAPSAPSAANFFSDDEDM
mmetsp:Transcript_34368/g.102109  ORF Transcript_34368/g.102109 Transcript_34368/m.102109 type:complete len:160 (-) Transcript_34368:276-755(-)